MNRRDRNVRFADAQMLSEQNNKFFIVLLKILTRGSWLMDINKLYAPSNFFVCGDNLRWRADFSLT